MREPNAGSGLAVPDRWDGVTAAGAPPLNQGPDGWPAILDRRGPNRPQVSVVVPTFNEADNLPVLLDRLELVLAQLDFEIVVVDDDSPDQTWRVAEAYAERSRRVRVMRRIGRRGLASAVLDGMAIADGQVLAVIDADLQHDESILPAMVAAVADGGADVCIGSRVAEGGSYGQFRPSRRVVSWAGTQLARSLLGVTVGDPMSGFFTVSRSRFELVRSSITGRGFKILLEIVARGPKPQVAEVGYCFRERASGATKLTASVATAYLVAVMELTLGRLASARFIVYFALALAAAAARPTLSSLIELIMPKGSSGRPGPTAALLGAEAAILAEFALHNRVTFARASYRGWRRVGPLFRFHLVAGHALLCYAGLGTLVNRRLTAINGTEPTATGVASLFAIATVGVVAVIGAGYLLNTAVTWPGFRASIWPPSGPPSQAGPDARRPITASTRPEISATARR